LHNENAKMVLILIVTTFYLFGVIGLLGAQGKTSETAKEPPMSKPYPIGQVTITLHQVGAGVGVEWGKGRLTFKGKEYTFKTKGLQLATVGIKGGTVTGDVYNMMDIGQFAGNYVGAQGGATLGAGGGGMVLQNQQGVRMHLKGGAKGLNLNIGPEGLNVVMEKAL
jgi:hypothetical protein